jgi:hypothetical protein
MMAVSDMDAAVNENGRNEGEEKLMQISGLRDSIVIWLLKIVIYSSPRNLERTHLFVYLVFAHDLQWSI